MAFWAGFLTARGDDGGRGGDLSQPHSELRDCSWVITGHSPHALCSKGMACQLCRAIPCHACCSDAEKYNNAAKDGDDDDDDSSEDEEDMVSLRVLLGVWRLTPVRGVSTGQGVVSLHDYYIRAVK